MAKVTVVIESKIGSKEGSEQLRRYAEHLNKMADADGKALLYITRVCDPKEPGEILPVWTTASASSNCAGTTSTAICRQWRKMCSSRRL